MELLIIIAALIAYGIFVLIRYLLNRGKGQDGVQYRELQNLVAAALPCESGLRVVYGFREDVDHKGKVTLTTYYRFALAFCGNCLWIAPLGFEKKTNEMGLTAPMTPVRPEELGMVTANSSRKKDILILKLYRKDHSQPVNCHIEAISRKNSRFHRTNICQAEACETLCEQMEIWAKQINPANVELQAAWKAEDQKEAKVFQSYLLGLAGVFLGVIFGPLGLALALWGLHKAHVGKKAGVVVPKGYVAIDIMAIVVSLLNTIVLLLALITVGAQYL